MRAHRLTWLLVSLPLVLAAPAAAESLLSERSAFLPGLWWTPAQPGDGFELYHAGGGSALIWYTYRADGLPVWYTAQGDVVDGRFEGELLRHRWSAQGYAGSQVVGSVELAFDHAEHATLEWEVAGRTGSRAIEPFPMSGIVPETDHTGAWFDPAEPGYGLALAEQGEMLGATLYHYDSAGEPFWVAGSNAEGSRSIALHAFTGACPGCAPRAAQGDPAGELRVELGGEHELRVDGGSTLADAGVGAQYSQRMLTLLTQPASARAADRQLARFEDPDALETFIEAGLAEMRMSFPGDVVFSPPPPSTTYSTTNNLETGVDEADRFKSDGRFLYAFAEEDDGSLSRAVRVAELTDAGIEPRSTFALHDDSPGQRFAKSGLYVTGDRLVAHLSTVPSVPLTWIWPELPAWQQGRVLLELFDRSTPGAPTSIWRAELQGHLLDSRLIDDQLYLVTRHVAEIEGLRLGAESAEDLAINAALFAATPLQAYLPSIRVGDAAPTPAVAVGDVLLPPMAGRRPQPDFIVVTRVDIHEPDDRESIAVLGGVEVAYVAENALWLAGTRHGTGFDLVHGISLNGFLTTEVHKLALGGESIEVRASGRIEGSIDRDPDRAALRLSQLGEQLRVVSASWHQWGSMGLHRLTVLEESAIAPGLLRTVSYLPNRTRPEPIGKPDELLYGTRFVGDRLYAVTFRMVDPLYVVDLADPADPKLAGVLELPGFSDYLHPLPGGLLLGVGKDATGTQQTLFQGVKLSLFDVADVGSPQVLQELIIGRRGSESALLAHHHALSVLGGDGTRPLRLGIPMRIHDAGAGTPANPPADYFYPWNRSGLFLFELQGTGAQAQLVPGGELITARASTQQPPFPDAGANGGRSLLLPGNTVYVERGNFWLQAFGSAAASGPH